MQFLISIDIQLQIYFCTALKLPFCVAFDLYVQFRFIFPFLVIFFLLLQLKSIFRVNWPTLFVDVVCRRKLQFCFCILIALSCVLCGRNLVYPCKFSVCGFLAFIFFQWVLNIAAFAFT